MEDNPFCSKCMKKRLEPIFGTGRSLWCPDCDSLYKEKEKTKEDKKWIQGDGFKLRELPKIGSPEDKEEVTPVITKRKI